MKWLYRHIPESDYPPPRDMTISTWIALILFLLLMTALAIGTGVMIIVSINPTVR